MENIFLFKIEIFVLIVSILYILYFLWEKIFLTYFKFKKIISPKRETIIPKKINKEEKTIIKTNNQIKNNKKIKQKEKKENIRLALNPEDKQKIIDLLKKIKINIEKWFTDKARTLIIEWLTIDKYNKELNLELASIYEWEKNYKKAELIYNDLILYYKTDIEIKKILWFNLAMQNKLKKSFNVYEEVFKKRRNDITIIEMLLDLSYDLKEFDTCLKYINLFLKDKPRNVEKLFMKWICLEWLLKINDAIIVYKKILDVEPYNKEIIEKINNLNN